MQGFFLLVNVWLRFASKDSFYSLTFDWDLQAIVSHRKGAKKKKKKKGSPPIANLWAERDGSCPHIWLSFPNDCNPLLVAVRRLPVLVVIQKCPLIRKRMWVHCRLDWAINWKYRVHCVLDITDNKRKSQCSELCWCWWQLTRVKFTRFYLIQLTVITKFLGWSN